MTTSWNTREKKNLFDNIMELRRSVFIFTYYPPFNESDEAVYSGRRAFSKKSTGELYLLVLYIFAARHLKQKQKKERYTFLSFVLIKKTKENKRAVTQLLYFAQ